MDGIFEEIVKKKRSGEKTALATVVSVHGSSPRKVGTKMLVNSDGSILGSIGGGCLEAEVWEASMKTIEDESPRMLNFDLTGREETPEGLICGGIMQVFVDAIIPVSTVYIFGAGHIGFTVSKIAKMIGFDVTVIDDRPAYANAEKFPEADKFFVEDPADAVSKLDINKVSYLVIACRGHLEDQRVLAQALKTPAGYIGMIGSKKKVKTVFTNLRNQGFDQAVLDKVHAPIGLPIGAETPEEIAISIMAEIVEISRRK